MREDNNKKRKIEELNKFLNMDRSKQQQTPSVADVLTGIKKEIAVFQDTGERPAKIELIYRALLTLPPTSVEAERAFSAAGLFVTKLRSRLNDNTLNVLCFLRSHFLKQNQK